jgi:hypothetical protein
METLNKGRYIKIPLKLHEAFKKEQRILLDERIGLWPIDARMIKEGFLDKVLDDKEFNAQFDIVIMPKQGM